jgi:hypothetical protein
MLEQLSRVQQVLRLLLLQVEIERELPKFRSNTRGRLEELLRDCLRVRAEMSHFATNLQYYLTFEVLGGK